MRSPAPWLLLLVVAVSLSPVFAQTLPPLTAEQIASGLASPVAVTHAGDDRLFVTLQGGQIVIVRGGAVLPVPFLDIDPLVGSGGERGLLSVAFHPRYALNGFFFVNYTDNEGDTVIARYSVSANPDRADAQSGRVLLRIEQPFPNHNGGQLQFGPDGCLYIGMGDGGAGFDPQCLAQDDSSLLGKMLRLDVDRNVNTPPHHAIPGDNPFVGPGAPRDEIWSKGWRNPWRFSFDRLTGDLFVGDVGQNQREEISRERAGDAGGDNYGWKVWEGDLCLDDTSGCAFPVPPCSSPLYTAPILTYAHTQDECSVTGGYVYRGAAIAALRGRYVYADYCSGRMWAAREIGGVWQAEVLPISIPILTSFGEDAGGELYFTAGSSLYRLRGPAGAPTCTPSATTLCLLDGRFQVEVRWRSAQSNQAFASGQNLTPDSGFFWFVNPDNPEIFVKVRNACSAFDRIWVFAAGLTDVEVLITVVDTETGAAKSYLNPQGQAFVAVQDTGAFATCP